MWRFLAGLVVAAGVFFGAVAALNGAYARGDKAGWDRRDAVAEHARADASEAARRTEALAAAAAATVDAQHTAAAERIRVVYRTLEREIPAHVTPEIDRRYPLPVGLVRLYDAAVLGVPAGGLADPAGRPDDGPSDVAASHAALVFTDNGRACRADQQRLAALQQLIRGQPGYLGP